MTTGPQYTPTPTPGPAPGGGRGGALLVGGIAFAVVFLLIVGATVGYLVVRQGRSGGTTPPTASATPSDPEDSATSEAPTEVEEERCYAPESDRTSENPSGKLRGGGLEFIPPAIYDGRMASGVGYFVNDTQVAYAAVESTWVSTLTVGRVEWQEGVEYPGDEIASQKIAKCFFSNGDWGDMATQRTWDDETTKPVTVGGMPGYETRAVVNFGKTTLKKTTATEIVVVVVATDDGPSAFLSETSVGVTEHEEAADEAYASLTGLSG